MNAPGIATRVGGAVLALGAVVVAISPSGWSPIGPKVIIVAPSNGEFHELPVRIRWSSDEDAPAYAVFIDREPVGPGADLNRFAPDGCEDLVKCLTVDQVRETGVIVTSSDSVELSAFPYLAAHGGDDDHHRITVVALDVDGARDGDRGGTTVVRTPHEESPL